MTNDRETAAKIIDEHYESGRNFMYAAIVAALEAARDTAFVAGYAAGLDHLREAVALRGIIDCTGEVPCVRRVLGVLPVTADGCVVQVDEYVYHPEGKHSLRVARYDESYGDHNEDPLPDDCEFCAVRSYYEHDTGYSEFEMYDVRRCYSTPEAAKAAMEGGKA